MFQVELARLLKLNHLSSDGVDPENLPTYEIDRILLLGRFLDNSWIVITLYNKMIFVIKYECESYYDSPKINSINIVKENNKQLCNSDWLPIKTYVTFTDFEFAREMLRMFGENFKDTLTQDSPSSLEYKALDKVLESFGFDFR